jgi:geranylgeranyl pyrophosphate synthase
MGFAPGDAVASEATQHLKQVPPDAETRAAIHQQAERVAADWDKSRAFTRAEIEARARALLERLQLPEAYFGWTMVVLASAFWHDQVAGVPYHRRLLLLPHCLRHATECPAAYSELGLACQDCGRCRLTELRGMGEQLGYRVMIAEGSPVVMQLILTGQADAIVGAACLDALEKTLDKILLAGIPCLATPLLKSGCRNTEVDEERLRAMIRTPYRPAGQWTQSYLHLLRGAAAMFEPRELRRLIGVAAAEGNGHAAQPQDTTEAIALEFLAAGGKYFRPFISLAAYDALADGACTRADGPEQVAEFTDAVRRMALAIEVFHKASLVHDDIEDDDPFRYGRPTVHRNHGTAMAINVGDWLIGLGYRLVADQRGELGAAVVADVLAQLAHAHTRLCEGQGAELAWRNSTRSQLTPLEVLRIYALKTAPAFEAALYIGLRLASPADNYWPTLGRFARHLGVGYQILNDLDDWQATGQNKRQSGTDVLGRRPTILLAMALETLAGSDRQRLETLLSQPERDAAAVAEVAELYRRADVFRAAEMLVAKHRQRATEAVAQLEPEPLRRLLQFLVDGILRA